MTAFKRHLPPLGALLSFNLFVFARLVFRTAEGVPYFTIPFDFASQYAPWLIYVGDGLRASSFPLWTPYVAAGTPFFINPQSQMYSPLTLLVAPTIGYTQHVAQLQSVFLLFFGGAGAYALSQRLWRSRWAGLVSAVCYNFTSALFSNLEHTTIINAASLLPWLFFAATVTAHDREAWGFPLLAFFLYFLITSGYPGVVLMALLWLTVYIVYLVYRQGDAWRVRLRLLTFHALAGLLGLGLAAAHWLPVVVHRNEFTRGAPLDLDTALLGGNLYFKHLWGMLFFFMVEHPLPGPDADISMRGLYLGAIALPLALAALLLLKTWHVRASLVLASGAFLMACGGMFFGRVFLHVVFPVLNMSRFPSADSRSLMALGLALLAGGGASLLHAGSEGGRSFVSRACWGLLAALLVGLYGLRRFYPEEVYHAVVLNYVTAEVYFVAVALMALRFLRGRALLACLVGVLVLEAGTSVAANMKIVGAPVASAEAYRAQWRVRRGFTPEAANAPRRVPADGAETLVSEESGRGYVHKTFYLTDYNPLRLHRFDTLINNGFKDWLATGPRVVALPPAARPRDFASFNESARPVAYTILSYTPNRVVYRVRAETDALLVFNEIYFPGWRAQVDGRAARLGEVGGGLRALAVGSGEHTVVTTFRPRSFVWGVGVSLASALLFLAWLFVLWYAARRRRRRGVQAEPGPAAVEGTGAAG